MPRNNFETDRQSDKFEFFCGNANFKPRGALSSLPERDYLHGQ